MLEFKKFTEFPRGTMYDILYVLIAIWLHLRIMNRLGLLCMIESRMKRKVPIQATTCIMRYCFDQTETIKHDFMIQLTKDEFDEISRCNYFTSSWGGTRYLPYAFTEQGIYMLMTVLRGNLAVKQSRALVMAFKAICPF